MSTYEGQAAIQMEALADPDEQAVYPFEITRDAFDPAPLWELLLADWRRGVSPSLIAARFHNSVAEVSVELCRLIRQDTGVNTVALSGGVWQNRLLLHKSTALLEKENFNVLTHRRVPANDGGVALGQMMVAAWLTK